MDDVISLSLIYNWDVILIGEKLSLKSNVL